MRDRFTSPAIRELYASARREPPKASFLRLSHARSSYLTDASCLFFRSYRHRNCFRKRRRRFFRWGSAWPRFSGLSPHNRLEFSAAITWTRCVAVGSRVLSARRLHSRVRRQRWAAPPKRQRKLARARSGNICCVAGSWERRRSVKFVEFLVIHPKGFLHFSDRLIPSSSGKSARL